jgi:DNA polymerase-3 subunit epsilon
VNEQLSFDFSQPEQNEALLPGWAGHIAVFDTETTGLLHREARIVTACIAEIDASGNLIQPATEWLADPEIEIPDVAASVHGVTTEIARRDGRQAKVVISEILEHLNDLFSRKIPVVAHNAVYDFSILHFEALRHGLTPLDHPMPVIDTLVLDKQVDRYRKGKGMRTLIAAAGIYGVDLIDAHNATADAVAAGRLAQAIAKKYAAVLPDDAAQLHDKIAVWHDEQAMNFAEFKRATDPNFKAELGWPVRA